MKVHVQVETVTLTCGRCGWMIFHPKTGSSFWTEHEIDSSGKTRPRTIKCTHCGAIGVVPKHNG